MKKKLLYIDHSFHNKTKSAQFLEELLCSAYDVETCDFDPYDKNPDIIFDSFTGRDFDVLVLFQVMPNIKKLKEQISFKYPVFFPMFDASGGLDDAFWEQYREFNIINFSYSLHKRLLKLGLSSYYIQYFPKPIETFDFGDPAHVFFWQRVTDLGIDMVEKLLKKNSYNRIHLHRVLDPFQTFRSPSRCIADKVEYSDWYDTREEMLKDVESCAFYIAPRLYEGIGMSFLEAMAMGRCVIAPNFPTMNEYIVHGENGFLYDYHYPKSIRINNIDRIQKNAYEYVKEGYAQWEVNKYKILDWLEAPLGGSVPLPMEKQKKEFIIKKYTFCGKFPLLILESKPYQRYYKLFGSWCVWKCKRKGNKIIFYLFGFIPVWKASYW